MFKKNLEDTIIAEGRNQYASNSAEGGTSRLVRTVSKAFTSHGCEKSGVGGHFLTYLQDKGMKNQLHSEVIGSITFFMLQVVRSTTFQIYVTFYKSGQNPMNSCEAYRLTLENVYT